MVKEEKIEDLKRCPFCGMEDIDPKFWSSGDGKSGPGCNNCGATAESIEKWDNRMAENPCSKIFDHKWLDPVCVENGCQSLLLKAAREESRRLREALEGIVFSPCIGTDENNDTCGVTFTCWACQQAKLVRAILAKTREQALARPEKEQHGKP